eukprot:15361539-Ditylum_brightwellii.AAC.1
MERKGGIFSLVRRKYFENVSCVLDEILPENVRFWHGGSGIMPIGVPNQAPPPHYQTNHLLLLSCCRHGTILCFGNTPPPSHAIRNKRVACWR